MAALEDMTDWDKLRAMLGGRSPVAPKAEGHRLAPQQKVGGDRYTLVRMLGRGGMGVVWQAHDERLGEVVALKFLPPELQSDALALEDLRREVLRNRRLSHPNILRVHDLHGGGEAPFFLSMEFVDGADLVQLRVQQNRPVLEWRELRPWMAQLCEALAYAHAEKVVHRDLKPGNLLVDHQGRLKLADFGIAAVMSSSLNRISAGKISGTLSYMSPQQLQGRPPTPADDLYAAGATLYDLLTSRPPFHQGDVSYQTIHMPPAPLAERLNELGLRNEIPGTVADAVMACLSKEPEQRPASAGVLAQRLGLSASSGGSGQRG